MYMSDSSVDDSEDIRGRVCYRRNTCKDYYIRFFQSDTGAVNAVTSIYLDYRVFDTLFEALLLLIGVTAVIYLSWNGRSEDGE